VIAYVGLDHVQLAAPPGCEAAARAFYGGLLGMVEVPKPADMAARGGCWFQCGPQQLHIGVEAEFAPAKKAHPGIRLADREGFEALAARLEGEGVAVKRDRQMEGDGVQRFFVHDPWGNRLELVLITRT
jgi:catechol 2,3-dioxygenase-like lactoylglutathione lyase family enzyme